MKFFEPLFRKLGYVPIANGKRQRRSFQAAAGNRLTNDWRSNGESLDSILSTDLDRLRHRSRDLAENNDYFQKYLSMFRANVIGDCGMTLKNKATEPPSFSSGEIVPGKLDKLGNWLVEDAWWRWGRKENCTTTKKLTWCQVQHLTGDEFATAGECIWEHVIGPEADNEFNYALRPVSIDRIATWLNQDRPNGNKIRLGIESNSNMRVVAYWLTDTDPTDILGRRIGRSYNAKRYEAERFVHPFLMRRIGQSRGYPFAAASMLRMKMLAGYDVATITAAEAGACKMGFITKVGTGVEYTGENANGGGKYMDAEPGMLEELPQGMDVKVVDWNQPNGNYDPFVKACLRGIAAGLCVSYPNLANDYEGVNFSSGRMARLEEIEFWKLLQCHLASDFHEPIFSKWLEMALLSQAIKYPGSGKPLPRSQYAKFNAPNFHGRRWGWVDPTKEVAAKSEELRLKITSHTRICAELGIDRDELFDEIEDDKAAAESRGITLPDEAAAEAVAVAAQPNEAPGITDNTDNSRGFRYNENHDPENGQFTGGGGGGGNGNGSGNDGGSGGKERLRDRIEGTQKEADAEVKKTAEKVASIKEKIESLKKSKPDAKISELKEKYDAVKQKQADIQSKLDETNARIAALKAKLKPKRSGDETDEAEAELENQLADLKDILKQIKDLNKQVASLAEKLEEES